MRLVFVEICGFRGFRDRVRLQFGTGFTVIGGRNGVGKSTVCDAVEFAITGRIDKYKVESSAKETLEDYLWWRGDGASAAHYVSVGFIAENGEPFVIERRRESGPDKTDAEIVAALCSGPVPENALAQLCKTSIIRDEWIAALSLDLTETERFDLVRSALGAVEGAEIGVKADAVLASAKATHERNESGYLHARIRLTQGLTQLAEAQDEMARAGDVAAALLVLKDAAPVASEDLLARLSAGRQALSERRSRLGPMTEAIQMARDLQLRRQEFDVPDEVQRRVQVHEALTLAKAQRDSAEAALEAARRTLTREEAIDVVATSLASLVEHGERLGLHADHCPLCAAARTEAEFAAGLALARGRIAVLQSGVSAARDSFKAAQAAAEPLRQAFYLADQEAADIEQQERLLSAQKAALSELLATQRLDASFAQNPNALAVEYEKERGRLIDLERALLTLEASQAISRISSLEDQVAAFRNDAESSTDLVSASQAALAAAREIERAVRRVSAEIVDERLAQISPLLNELYQRLRPHAAWRSIDYSIRGDVRRFLSLKVGDNLNPQFVFSSGQRRAAGLAFLLSVHLARAWTSWRTLLLDDPVQHIDDFRALQLVEVLAAFRLDGRQIICAVEDEDLADLLCRRLVSTPEALGRRYDIGLNLDGVTTIISEVEIPPLSSDVLRSRSGLQVVG